MARLWSSSSSSTRSGPSVARRSRAAMSSRGHSLRVTGGRRLEIAASKWEELWVEPLWDMCATPRKSPWGLNGLYVLKVSDRRCKLHRVQRVSSSLAPREWSSTCGGKFKFWAFTPHPSAANFPLDALSRCFERPPTTLAQSSSQPAAPVAVSRAL